MTATDNAPRDQKTPYGDAAERYWTAGWHGPLPLPPRAKALPPEGYTGGRGTWPSFADVYAWTEDRPDGNICLRLPPDVIGIDVDHYGNKPGGLVLAQHEQDLGALPATWRTTSRDDGISGIRLYRIPVGLRWPSVLGPGIETVRHGHRYALVWPSIHPDTGGTYRWINPNGHTAIGELPAIDDLPDLPDTWIEHFTGGELADEQHKAALTDEATREWLNQRAAGTPCRHTQHALSTGLPTITNGESRHDAALKLTNRLIWTAGEGHTGALQALTDVRAVFLKATAGDRGTGEAEAEWDRMITGAVARAAHAHPKPSTDPCHDPFHGLIDRRDQSCSDAPSTTPTPQKCPTSATTNASLPATATTACTTPSPGPKASASTNATEDTSGPADGAETTPGSTSTTEARTSPSPDLNPDDLQAYYLQELARITARTAAQKHYDEHNTEQVVADRVRRKLLDDQATKAYREATEPPAPEFDMGTLAEILARPDEPPMRVDKLIPWSASTLIVAQRKSGKTTLLLNYADALLTGNPFLGTFPVIPLEPHQTIALLNYEVNGKMLARWANDIDIDPERLILVNLRGRRNPLGHDEDRAKLVQSLVSANVGAVFVDPFGRAYTGDSQNDNAEVQRFLVGLDQFAREEVGAHDLVLTTHAGWDGERTRGASALEDWPDTIINLAKVEDDSESHRYFRALGRDVEVDEDAIVMDPITRRLKLAETGPRRKPGKKSAGRVRSLAVLVNSAVNQSHEAMSKTQLGKAIRALPASQRGGLEQFGEQLLSDAIEMAYAGDFIVVHRSQRNGKGMVIHRRDILECGLCGTDRSQKPTAPSGSGAVPQTTAPDPRRGERWERSERNDREKLPERSETLIDPATGQRVNPDTGEVVDNASDGEAGNAR